jgi:hypothetical protein
MRRNCPGLGKITVQLATVTKGQSQALAVHDPGWSVGLAAGIGRIPELTVRVRFSSSDFGYPGRLAWRLINGRSSSPTPF